MPISHWHFTPCLLLPASRYLYTVNRWCYILHRYTAYIYCSDHTERLRFFIFSAFVQRIYIPFDAEENIFADNALLHKKKGKNR